MTGIGVLSELPFDPVMVICWLGVMLAAAAAVIASFSVKYQKRK